MRSYVKMYFVKCFLFRMIFRPELWLRLFVFLRRLHMDTGSLLIFLALAMLSIAVLYFSGLLKKPIHVALALALTALAFWLRYICMDHVTLDYENFLSRWVQYFRDNGGFAALSQSVGNYNVPYLYFLALFSYSDIYDLYLIKLLSVFFDVVLAWSAMKLAGLFTDSVGKKLLCFFAVLLWPSVILNGSCWGQCDSIYAAFAVLSVYLVLDKKPVWGMVCIAVSFAFKLQAVFIMPIFAVFLFTKRVKLWHFLIFPLTYLALMLPAVMAGRPLWDTVTLYFDQMGSVGGGLNYNSSSVYAFVSGDADTELLSAIGVAAAFAFTASVIFVAALRGRKATDWALLGAAVLFCVGIPFLLPHMHDRYFFVADIMTLVFAVTMPEYFFVPLLCEFASLLGYHAYLKQRYLLPMRYGAAALIIVLVMLLFFFAAQLREESPKNRRGKKRPA